MFSRKKKDKCCDDDKSDMTLEEFTRLRREMRAQNHGVSPPISRPPVMNNDSGRPGMLPGRQLMPAREQRPERQLLPGREQQQPGRQLLSGRDGLEQRQQIVAERNQLPERQLLLGNLQLPQRDLSQQGQRLPQHQFIPATQPHQIPTLVIAASQTYQGHYNSMGEWRHGPAFGDFIYKVRPPPYGVGVLIPTGPVHQVQEQQAQTEMVNRTVVEKETTITRRVEMEKGESSSKKNTSHEEGASSSRKKEGKKGARQIEDVPKEEKKKKKKEKEGKSKK